MTQSEVQNALVAHLSDALGAVLVTTSLEDAIQNYEAGTGWVLVTAGKHEPNQFQDEDNWEFNLQMSMSLQPGAQATTTSANDADQTLIDDVLEAVNGDDGFAALMAAGLFDPQLKGLGDDQQNEATINPHVFTCSSY